MTALNSIVSNGVTTGATYLKFNSGNTNINFDKMVSGNTTIEPKERILGSNVPRFTACTDAEIEAVLQGYYNHTISLDDIRATWHVGDTRTIHLNAVGERMWPEGYPDQPLYQVNEHHREQDIDIVIIGFNHDVLTDPEIPRTNALITVQLKDVLLDQSHAGHNTADYYDGETNTENGNMHNNDDLSVFVPYDSTERHAWCIHGFRSMLPNWIQRNIQYVEKICLNNNNETFTVSTPVFLLSHTEVTGGDSGLPPEGTQYEYYQTPEGSFYCTNINKYPIWTEYPYEDFPENPNNQVRGTSTYWWLRSPGVENHAVSTTHMAIGPIPNTLVMARGTSDYGISPAWCM